MRWIAAIQQSTTGTVGSGVTKNHAKEGGALSLPREASLSCRSICTVTALGVAPVAGDGGDGMRCSEDAGMRDRLRDADDSIWLRGPTNSIQVSSNVPNTFHALLAQASSTSLQVKESISHHLTSSHCDSRIRIRRVSLLGGGSVPSRLICYFAPRNVAHRWNHPC